MLLLDDAIRSAVRSGGRNEDIRTLARHNGMKLMQEFALARVRDGLTTLDEVQRVVPFEQMNKTQCPTCQQELSPAFIFCPYCGEQVAQQEKPKRRRRSLVGQGAAKE
jgi:hypothetical protein